MKKPVRLQLSRKKGFNLQALSRATNGRDAVNVTRLGKLGNPFIVGKHGTRAECVAFYEWLLAGFLCVSVDRECVDAQRAHLRYVKANIESLRGKNLACWCQGKPCHGDTLLAAANRRVRK
jgi:hypothetical protein